MTDSRLSFVALKLVPRLGRKKILVGSRKCGRNELVADYILRKTGETRSRKQVSSHLQVLKNVRKNDKACSWSLRNPPRPQTDFSRSVLEMVREPLDGTDTWGAGCEAKFFFDSSDAGAESEAMDDETEVAPLCSPIPKSVRPAVSSPVDAMLSPLNVTRPRSVRSVSSSTPKSYLPPFNNDLPLPVPTTQQSIVPAVFCIWTTNPHSGATENVLTNLTTTPSGISYFDNLHQHGTKFPKLAEMRTELSCPFLLANISLDIPSSLEQVETKDIAKINTMLRFTSSSPGSLTSITTIYSYGQKVLSLVDDLDAPTRTRTSNSASSSDAQRYSHVAPFAADFWSIFLRGVFETPSNKPKSTQPQMKKNSAKTSFNSFSKVGEERADFSTAIEGVSVVQEFVVRNRNGRGTKRETGASAGSKLGTVVLVSAYQFECSTLDDEVPTTSEAGSVTFTSLQLRPPPLPVSSPPIVPLSEASTSHTPYRPLPRRVVFDIHLPSALSSPFMSTSRSAPTFGALGIEITPLLPRSTSMAATGSTDYLIPWPQSNPPSKSSNYSPTYLFDPPRPAMARSQSYSIRSAGATSISEHGFGGMEGGRIASNGDWNRITPPSCPILTPPTSSSIVSSTPRLSISSTSSLDSEYNVEGWKHDSRGFVRSPHQASLITHETTAYEGAYERAIIPQSTKAQHRGQEGIDADSTNVDDYFNQLLGGISRYSSFPPNY